MTLVEPAPMARIVPSLSTAATSVFSDWKVMFLFVASSGKIVTSRDTVSPASIVIDQLSTFTLVTGITLACTVNAHAAENDPAVAVMSAFPAETAVTLPFSSTVAIEASELLHVTFLSVAFSGATVAFNTRLSPATMVALVWSKVIPVTATSFAATVTVQVAVLEPSVVVTVIVVEPALTAVTLPLLSTVAMFESDDFQLTALLVALSGVTVAVKVSEVPSVRLMEALLMLTPVTATVLGPSLFPPPLGPTGSSFLQPVDTDATAAAMAIANATLQMVFFISRKLLNIVREHMFQR